VDNKNANISTWIHNSITQIIEDMVNAGRLEVIPFHIYRRKVPKEA
jgi:hypothetical protein